MELLTIDQPYAVKITLFTIHYSVLKTQYFLITTLKWRCCPVMIIVMHSNSLIMKILKNFTKTSNTKSLLIDQN